MRIEGFDCEFMDNLLSVVEEYYWGVLILVMFFKDVQDSSEKKFLFS